MSITYNITTNFGAKDGLAANDPDKVVRGSEFSTEFEAIKSAFVLAAPSASPTFTGTATFANLSATGTVDLSAASVTFADETMSSLTVTGDLAIDTDTLFVDASANRVGVGTASPFTQLSLYAESVAGTPTYSKSREAGFNFYQDSTDGFTRKLDIVACGDAASGAGSEIALFTETVTGAAAVERMRIDASGNVGIGETNPATRLHVDVGTTNDAARFVSTDAQVNLLMGDNGGSVRLQQDTGDFVFYSGTSAFGGFAETMRIDSNGNVGIGETSPTFPLVVSGSTQVVASFKTTNTTRAALALADANSSSANHVTVEAVGDELAFRANAIERLRIASSGNVGIGTNSPSTQLEVRDDTQDAAFTISSSAAGGFDSVLNFRVTGSTIWSIGADNSDGDKLKIGRGGTLNNLASTYVTFDTSGNVGIGTAIPSASLDVESEIHINDAASTNPLRLKQTGADAEVVNVAAGDIEFGLANDGEIHFVNGVAKNKRMTIDATGNVGIGTTPSTSLHVKANDATLTLQDNAGTKAQINYVDSSDNTLMEMYSGGTDFVTNLVAGGSWIYRDNGTERFRIDPSGNVGIGTATPASRLHVDAPLGGVGEGLRLQNSLATVGGRGAGIVFESSNTDIATIDALTSGASNSGFIRFRTASSGTISEAMRIDPSGNLLVGRTSSTAGYAHQFQSSATDVTFNAYRPTTGGSGSIALFSSDQGGAFTAVCAIRVDGDLENINNSYGALSDARLKSDIVDANPQLDDIMAVKVRSYTLNATGDKHIGVVAQELEEAGLNGLVQTNDEGMKSVKYSVLYMKAIKALQEQQELIEALTARVTALESGA